MRRRLLCRGAVLALVFVYLLFAISFGLAAAVHGG